MAKKQNLIWLDLEFSGLNFDSDTILEIATIVTDDNLNVLAAGPNIAIQTSTDILESMDQWNTQHHTDSGLVQKCLQSTTTLAEAERQTLDFLQEWTEKGASPLCGNSVGQDRRMLAKDMPLLEKYFHYRVIDVSTIKELSYRWYPELPKFEKEETHTALRDIEESIEELKHYQQNVFTKSIDR